MNRTELSGVIDKAISGDEDSVIAMWQMCKKMESFARENGHTAIEKDFYQLGNCWMILAEDMDVPFSAKNAVRQNIKKETLSAVGSVLEW